MTLGASPRDWAHFDLVLGLGADLLPVVADPNAPKSAGSMVKKFGKTPSAYDREGNAHGLSKWTERVITPTDIARWSTDARLSVCVRSSAVRAIDVDITEPKLAQRVWDVLPDLCRRIRGNSSKFLCPILLAGKHAKRIIDCGESGRIELLADGQQWLAAGCHESGVRYEWESGLPESITELTIDEFEALWLELKQFEVLKGVMPAVSYKSTTDSPGDAHPTENTLLTEIEPHQLVDLRSALAYPALLYAAGDNTGWNEIGYALLSLGAIGHQLWQDFSAAAPGYEPAADDDWWDAHESQTPRSDFRHIFTLARRLGWRTVADIGAFPIIAPNDLVDTRQTPDLLGKLPDSYHRTTDLANAHRLRDEFGGKHLIVLGGDFYAWSGKHWERSDSEAARCAAALPRLVQDEIATIEARYEAFAEMLSEEQTTLMQNIAAAARPAHAGGQAELNATDNGREALRAFFELDSLQKWRKACEMKSTQDHAVEMLRDLLQPRIAIPLDKDRYLLNCLNGTIDLRTGEMKPHDPNDFITKMARVEYNRDARAPRFEQFLTEILDQHTANFIQQWFGYCATGEIREQKMVLHIGPGANGKSTLLSAITDAIGDYAHTAPPGLLTAPTAERHPTEIADLAGRRLVTAHESDEGAVLREALLKQATGGDRLKARYMHRDFFEFDPTHKLQLLTNHKPTVRGQDYAIWRRLLLIWYKVSFGTSEDIASGKAMKQRDATLPLQIEAEREGVFNWIIQGAVEWYAQGLRPPTTVIEAGHEYQSEQDRMAQFVRECCILDPKAWSAFSGMFDAIYPTYTKWSKENGYQAMGVNKFVAELERVVPNYRREDMRRDIAGVRKTVRGCHGLRVNTEGDGGGSIIPINEGLL